MKVLGRCPQCGSNMIVGKFGVFCAGKCGFRFGKFRDVELNNSQIATLLADGEALIEDISTKDGSKTYNLLIKMDGVTAVEYNGKTFFYPKYVNRFPGEE